MKTLKPLAVLSLIVIAAAFVSGVVPVNAQGGAIPATNIRAFNGHNPGEVILTWNGVYEATHYRIGCVNLDRDYLRAKASVTGNWREAMVYVDVEAQNLVSDHPTYTLYGLQEGARHACAVLTNNARYGQPTWPTNPAWQYLTVMDHGGSCPVAELMPAPDTSEPLSIAEVTQLVRPALANLTVRPSDGFTYGGSGFVVRSDGLMVTARHVVDDADTVTAEMQLPKWRVPRVYRQGPRERHTDRSSCGATEFQSDVQHIVTGRFGRGGLRRRGDHVGLSD